MCHIATGSKPGLCSWRCQAGRPRRGRSAWVSAQFCSFFVHLLLQSKLIQNLWNSLEINKIWMEHCVKLMLFSRSWRLECEFMAVNSLLKTNGDLVPPKYWRHHRAHHRITPSQWTLRKATRKNPTTTKMETKNYYGTVITLILMYTTIQLKQKNLSRCRFANTTLLQLLRIIITKMRRHWKRQALKKVVPDATTTCPSSVLPTEQHHRRREILVALCVLVSFRCVLYRYVVVRTSS